MRVIYFNVGLSDDATISSLALFCKDQIDRDRNQGIIEGSSLDFNFEQLFDDKKLTVYLDRKEVFYKGTFLCYTKDLFRRGLTEVGKRQVYQTSADVCETLKDIDMEKIHIYLPSQMNHEEVLGMLYNYFLAEQQREIPSKNIVRDDRISEYSDVRFMDRFSHVEDRDEDEIRKDYEKDVLGFIKDLTDKKKGLSDEDVAIIIGGNELLHTISFNKKIQKYCPRFVGEYKTRLNPGEAYPMLIEAPKGLFSRDSRPGKYGVTFELPSEKQ